MCAYCYKILYIERGKKMQKNFPSIGRIQKFFGIDNAKAETVRGLLDRSIDPESLPIIKNWLKTMQHEPRKIEKIMEALNVTLEMFGIEAIRFEDWIDNYYCDICATYLNTGDTYAPTILYDTKNKKFILTTFGDFVEKNRHCL